MGNFLDEAKDVTEEVGYKPTKVRAKAKTKSPTFLDEAKDLGEAPQGAGEEVEPGILSSIANTIDIPFSIGRTAVEAAINPERDVIPAVSSQISNIAKSPFTAAELAPTGEDINKQAFGLQSSMTEQQRGQHPILSGMEKAARFGAGVATESLIYPLTWFKAGKRVMKPVAKALESASERQAAKAISQYASKSDVLKEGVDLDIIGARLVAEDMQGLLRNPPKLYEKIAGKRHLQKTMPDSLSTMRIEKGQRTGGMIGQISDDITNALKKVESEHGLEPQIPANIMMAQLMKNVRTNMSKTSGETVNLDKVQSILQETLKPFEHYSIPPAPLEGVVKKPGSLELGSSIVNKIPEGLGAEKTTLSLVDLQKLRKNIGKQVADRAFYAQPDANTRMETEVLRDLYRGLGDVIQSQLSGNKIRVGNTVVDAGDYYKAQNNRLKSLLDMESMLEYTPTEKLKGADATALMASMATKGGAYGAAGLAASMAGVPISPMGATVTGGILGAGQAAAEGVKSNAPEYLTSIFKTASKVASTPYVPEAAGHGAITYLRNGQFAGEPTKQGQSNYNFGNVKPAFPSAFNQPQVNQMEVAKLRLPRTTEGLIKNKEAVISKLMVNGVPDEMIQAITQALNEDPEAVGSIASMVAMQFPTLFEKSKYKMFDGKILDPQERAKAADEVSKRDDLNSLKKFKIINELNKTGKWIGE